jgi:hypothetical protein
MAKFRYPACELSERAKFLRSPSDNLSREFQELIEVQDYSRDDIRDCWLTLLTAIILGGISIVLIGVGIAKFSDGLKATLQSTLIDVPESVRREALSYIR